VHGAKIDARNALAETPLMWASARRHPPMMQFLISKGADVNARSTARDYQRHVQAEGRPKNLDSGGVTPLLYAARENCQACVKLLLNSKADINLPDPDGVSPLMLAIMNANWDIAKQLILAGADVNQWDIYGEAPLFTSIGLRNQASGGRGAIDPLNETNGTTIVHMFRTRSQSQHAAFLSPGKSEGRNQYAGLHAADSRGGRRGHGNDQAAVGTQSGRQSHDGRPADSHHCSARGPGVGETGSRDH
jgi:ankyrin repeat protein